MNTRFIRAAIGAGTSALFVTTCIACHSASSSRASASGHEVAGARPTRADGSAPSKPDAARTEIVPALHWRGAARSLEIEGRSGRIRATPIDGDAIEITARLRGASRPGHDGSLVLRVTPRGDGVIACVAPSDEGDEAPCPPPDQAWRNDRHAAVDIDVGVPGTIPLKVRHIAGDVDIERLRGDVDASTVSGHIHVETGGLARARAVNGSITARIGAPRWTGRLTFATVNGSIDVVVPRDAAADVSAHTVSGAISAEGVTFASASMSRDHFRGRLGSGSGGELELDTVNGAITLRPSS